MRERFEQWSEQWVMRSRDHLPGFWGWLVMVLVTVAFVVSAYRSGRAFDIIVATLLCVTLLLEFERRVFIRIIERQEATITALKWEKDALTARLPTPPAARSPSSTTVQGAERLHGAESQV